jgi:hypothetical protein
VEGNAGADGERWRELLELVRERWRELLVLMGSGGGSCWFWCGSGEGAAGAVLERLWVVFKNMVFKNMAVQAALLDSLYGSMVLAVRIQPLY